MNTSDQETSQRKYLQSELISHQLKSPQKKSTRPNSTNGDLNQEEKAINDEDSAGKLDFKQLRNKFETPDKSTDPTSAQAPPPAVKKRVSTPNNSATLNHAGVTTSLHITHRAPINKPPVPLPKTAKSSPAVPNTDETDHRPKLTIPQMRLSTNARSSTEESNSPSPSPSPLPTNPVESSVASENEVDDRPISVRSIRAFFNEPKNFPLRSSDPSNRPSPIPRKLAIPSSLTIPTQPLFRLAHSPEKYIKSQLHDSQSLPAIEIIETPTGDSSLSSNPNLSRSVSSDASFTDEEEQQDPVADRRIKLRKCLEEVYATEKTYVSILYVLAVKITSEVKNTCDMKDENLILTFNNTYKSLLGNIQQIYQLHHDMILPEMEQYIDGRLTGNMWSVFEKNYKVIEVLYKNYYVTYYDTQGKLDELCKTQPLINEAMLKCQSLLGNLYPITQLNCANQRLLRYILCMKTYIKYLGENAPEYKHSRAIHDELDRIAVRCEEELVVSATQLNELQERLDNKFECIIENRKLLWHGPLKKQSPRRYLDIAQRYAILFSDCLLVCAEESGEKLEIKRKLTMKGITVEAEAGGRASVVQTTEQTNTTIVYYPFRVNGVEKSYEFLTDKGSDRDIWVKKIQQASNEYNKRNSVIEIREPGARRDEQLGVRAPAWINDVDVTRCQNCNNRFPTTIISSRRHHCRCCGHCICGSCSTKKLMLEYCKHENEVRVCDSCYTFFTGTVLNKNTSIWPKSTREVDQTILFGDFRAVQSGGVVWIALQEDHQLHVYGGKLDLAEDYGIKLPEILEIQLEAETRTFTLRETTKTHVFTIDPTHQMIYEKNDTLDEKAKTSESKLIFYANLWHEAMQLARSTTLPDWYVRKRDSADSGVSNIG